MKTCVIIGAGGRGKDSYAPYIKEHNLLKIVGVVEPDKQKETSSKKAMTLTAVCVLKTI